jgi:hypothetical protein
VSASVRQMLDSLVTNAAPRDREIEAAKGRARSAARFERIARTYKSEQPTEA